MLITFAVIAMLIAGSCNGIKRFSSSIYCSLLSLGLLAYAYKPTLASMLLHFLFSPLNMTYIEWPSSSNIISLNRLIELIKIP